MSCRPSAGSPSPRDSTPRLRFLETFGFDDEELGYLGAIGFDDRALADLSRVRFDGEVRAVPEGRIVHGQEPILEVTAPIPVAQLVETFLMNQITLHSTLASKAARYAIAAEGRDLVEFSFRRTHGVDAAIAVARASAITGFVATSNVEAARRLGLPVAGTMAHSFIEAFPTEDEAFRAFAEDHPTRTTFLVDTYDTPNGVRNAIETIETLGLTGDVGVRLDSGDLDRLAREARVLLDERGAAARAHLRERWPGRTRGGRARPRRRAGRRLRHRDAAGRRGRRPLPRHRLQARRVRRPAGHEAVLGEGVPPGRKQVWRGRGDDGDVLALADDPGPDGWEPLLEPVMREGARLASAPPLDDLRDRFAADLAALPAKARRLSHPERVRVVPSEGLLDLTDRTRRDALAREGLGEPRASD